MSFLKSYYTSVSSFIVGDAETENIETEEKAVMDSQMKESKSEGWLKGIYNGAYNQSGELWKAVKTDLSEFATVISKDAKTVVVKTAIGVKNGLVGSEEKNEVQGEPSDNSNSSTSKIRNSIHRMLDQVSKALYIPPESDDDEYYYDNNDPQTVCKRIDARIANLQRDIRTFQTDPDQSEMDCDLGDYTQWQAKLNLDDFQSSIFELVKNNQQMFDHYSEMVPASVSHEEFWSRYFYRVASINSEESRREALKLRISNDEKTKTDTDPNDWDEGNDMCDESDILSKADVANVIQLEQADPECSNDVTLVNSSLKVKEKDDVIVVKHSIESSSASEDNNQDIIKSSDMKGLDDDTRWDDDIDIDINEEDLELARNTSETDVLEEKWDDWS